jgi:uroporphyrinogen III methyltransferase/synthase
MTGLTGSVVATTRDGDPRDPLVLALGAQGARVLSWPTIRFEEPPDPEALFETGRCLDRYAWVVFTSARAVTALAGIASAPEGRPRVAAVGTGTADRLAEVGWPVDVVGHGGAEALVAEMAASEDLHGTRVLFPAASIAHDTLETELAARGAAVDRIEAYRTVPSRPDADTIRRELAGGVDVVTFASPSAVRSLADSLGQDWPLVLASTKVVAIGPTTLAALEDRGVPNVIVAPEPSVSGLVGACLEAMEGK